MTMQKIISLAEMAQQSKAYRESGKRVVLCHGTFDLMHTGHIRYLQRAKAEGDILLVTVTGDAYVNKGPGRPVFSEQLRAESLAALASVDLVAINYAVSAVEALNEIRPSVYAKGSEYREQEQDVTGNITREQNAVEAHGGEIFYTDEITFSSSSLLNEHFNIFPSQIKDFLSRFRLKWTEKEIIKQIESLAKLKVLVVGDTIVDQYHYVRPLGQTGKSNSLAVGYESEEQFAGGAVAVANHLAGFADKVTLVTALGSVDNHEPFIRSKLLPNVEPVFFYFHDAPTVTKRRFVDEDLSKMFEIYFFKEEPDVSELEVKVYDWLKQNGAGYDVVVVPDFGNGFISEKIVAGLTETARFLAVNTQINSGNRGYHVINRYPKADFISLNEPEIRLAAHDRHSPLAGVIEQICKRLNASYVAVTRGTNGAVLTDSEQNAFVVPALSTKVLDRVGAGDAFLSLSALCLGGGLSPEVSAFVGSAAAALDVQIVCNREPISRSGLFKFITTLLK